MISKIRNQVIGQMLVKIRHRYDRDSVLQTVGGQVPQDSNCWMFSMIGMW